MERYCFSPYLPNISAKKGKLFHEFAVADAVGFGVAEACAFCFFVFGVGAFVVVYLAVAFESGLCHFSLKIFSNELLHSSFLFCNFVLSSN